MDRAFDRGCHTRHGLASEIESQEPPRFRPSIKYIMGVEPEGGSAPQTPTSGQKRKRTTGPATGSSSHLIPDGSPSDAADAAPLTEPKREAKKPRLASTPEEKRLRR